MNAAARHAAAAATLHLPFRLPVKDTITIRELAELSGMKPTFLEEQFDEGQTLSGFRFNGGAGRRDSKRIPRAWATAFLVRHADWTDDSLADAIIGAVRHFNRPMLLRVRAGVDSLLQNS